MTLGRFSRIRPHRPVLAYSTSSVIPGLAANFASLTCAILSEARPASRFGSGARLQREQVLLSGQPSRVPG